MGIRKEYRNILLDDEEDRFCIDESDHFVFHEHVGDETWDHWLFNLGVDREALPLMDKEFRQWMGLQIEIDDEMEEELERMDILYVYDAMDYEIYSKLVEYYWQDFVCFDYKADYKHDVLDYLTANQEKYKGFPVKNRTKTNWDLIVEFYYSKQNKHKI